MSDVGATGRSHGTNGARGASGAKASTTAGASAARATAACCVCGMTDARALTTTPLSNGAPVVVCANHEIMHRRSARPAASVAELRVTFADRRGKRVDRRGAFELDELGAQLTHGFAGERRESTRRR